MSRTCKEINQGIGKYSFNKKEFHYCDADTNFSMDITLGCSIWGFFEYPCEHCSEIVFGKTMKKIVITEGKNIYNSDIQSFCNCINLTHLELSNTQITDESLENIATECHLLRSVILDYNENINGSSFSNFKGVEKFSSLECKINLSK